MPASINVRISDITFKMSCPHTVDLEDLPDVYRPFLGATYDSPEKIAVELDLDNLPSAEKMRKIFDTEDSWSLYLDHDVYVVIFSPAVLDGKVLWTARFSREAGKISIRCSDMMVRKSDGVGRLANPFQYPLDQILLMYLLSNRNGCLIHAAGINVNSRGFIFPGKSGAGKSTLSRLFVGAGKGEMLSDDRIIIRKIDNAFRAFGTPWPGDAGIAENRSLPLSGIFFFCHGDKNIIKEIKPKEAIERLMPVTSIPWYDEKVMSDILSFCEDLVLNIPAYELYFRPDKEVVDFLEKFVSA